MKKRITLNKEKFINVKLKSYKRDKSLTQRFKDT